MTFRIAFGVLDMIILHFCVQGEDIMDYINGKFVTCLHLSMQEEDILEQLVLFVVNLVNL